MLNRNVARLLLPLALLACDGRDFIGPNYESVNTIAISRADGSGIAFAPRQGLNCAAGGGIHFTVEATLGSELAGLPPVTVTGYFTSPWTGPPAN